MAIVCGTDFSPGAAHAVRTAAAFARAFGERLVLVHVVDVGVLGWAAEGLTQELCKAAEARLAEEASALRAQGIEVETRALAGSPAERLVEAAREGPARLAVFGVHGQHRAERWRAGSLAARLARAAPVPVLLVSDAEPFERCARGERALRVLLAAAPNASGDAAAASLATLRRLGPCDALLLHVYEPGREAQRLGLSAGAPDKIEEVLRREIAERAGELPGPGRTELRAMPRIGWIADSLALVAEREGFDLILVGGRRRSGLARIRQDSVSEGLLQMAGTSVLRVPVAEPVAQQARPLPAIATVLATSDLSERSAEGVRHAFAVAPRGATVVLLHVIEVPPIPNPLYAHYGPRPTPAERAARAKEIEAALRALVPAEAEARGIDTRIEIVEGRPADAICTAAERLGADLVCVATQGRTGLARLLLGSVARELVDRCPRPLLLVRPERD